MAHFTLELRSGIVSLFYCFPLFSSVVNISFTLSLMFVSFYLTLRYALPWTMAIAMLTSVCET